MSSPDAFRLKAKKIGVLIRSARQAAHQTLADSAQLLGVSETEFEAFELGEQAPSLPQLELLSYYWGFPVENFWQNELLEHKNSRRLDQKLVEGLRHKIIGVMLRKSRVERNLSLDELAALTAISAEKINAFELGQIPAPVSELEVLAEKLGATMKNFRDQFGPLGVFFNQQQAIEDFKDLSPEMQVFVSRPVNRPYLELALRLSEMDVRKLRSVAEGLLEITY